MPLLDKLQFSSNVDQLLQNVKVRVRKGVFRLGEKSKDVTASCRGVQNELQTPQHQLGAHISIQLPLVFGNSCGEDDVLSSYWQAPKGIHGQCLQVEARISHGLSAIARSSKIFCGQLMSVKVNSSPGGF